MNEKTRVFGDEFHFIQSSNYELIIFAVSSLFYFSLDQRVLSTRYSVSFVKHLHWIGSRYYWRYTVSGMFPSDGHELGFIRFPYWRQKSIWGVQPNKKYPNTALQWHFFFVYVFQRVNYWLLLLTFCVWERCLDFF